MTKGNTTKRSTTTSTTNKKMNKRELGRFKSLLLRQKGELLNKTRVFKQEQKGSQTMGDEADIAVSELNLNMDLRLHERERFLMHKIEEALRRIEDGSYGSCEECGEALDAKRLEARPVATLCIACKEDQEVRERIYAYS